jgi:serine/threonine protein kinase
LHGKGVIHRDIKPQNLLLFPDGNLKLIDLGIARLLCDKSEVAHTKAGTIDYQAPEVDGGGYSTKADIWGLGITLYFMCTKESKYMGKNMIKAKKKGIFVELPKQYS